MSGQQTRRFFGKAQEQKESGGRQHDKDGKPLIGRYRDGSMPSESKRAYGAGQMQIGTARNTARQYGIAWDENRFMNDREYNLTLADKHMEHLTKKYGGDQRLAQAAYHSGEPTVDAAIKKYGRQNFTRGLGPEGRNYVSKIDSKSGSSGASTAGVVSEFESILNPEVAASQGVTQGSGKIFGSAEKLAQQEGAVERGLQQQGEAISFLSEMQSQLHAQQRESLGKQIEDTRAISTAITSATKDLQATTAPIFAARGRVNDQIDKLATMNPLERGLRGIFDLNYDKDFLQGQLDTFDRTLKARADDFDYVNKLHGVAMQEIDRTFKLDTGMASLMNEQAKEMMNLAGINVAHLDNVLQTTRQGIASEAQMIQFQSAAREELMGRIDTLTLGKLHEEAIAKGQGVIKFQGVELNATELRHVIQNREDQNEARELSRLARENQREDLALKQEERMIRYMSREEIKNAIQNGGVHNGVQLPLDALTSHLADRNQQAGQQAQAEALNQPLTQIQKAAGDAVGASVAMFDRGVGMFGSAAMQGSTPFMQKSTQLLGQIKQAVDSGQPPEVVHVLKQQLDENLVAYNGYIDQVTLNSVGGDKRAASYMKGFFFGTTLDQGTSAQALAYFATKGIMPSGVALTPATRQVFTRAKEIVEKHRNAKGANGKQIGEAELLSRVAAELGDDSGKGVSEARSMDILGSLTQVAKASNHAFGRLDPTKWSQIVSRADANAADAIAPTIGTNAANVSRMMQTGKPLDSSDSSKELFRKFQGQMANINGFRFQSIVRLLDAEPQITTGRRNSSNLLDFLNTPKFAEGVQTYGRAQGNHNFGEYLVNPLVQGGTMGFFQRYSNELRGAQSAVHSLERQAAMNPTTALMLKPLTRTDMILRAIPGVGAEGAKALAPFVKDFYSRNVRQEGARLESPNSLFRRQDAQLLAALQGTKFEDPRQETWRKLAIRGWEEHSTAQQGFIDRATESIFGDVSSIEHADRLN